MRRPLRRVTELTSTMRGQSVAHPSARAARTRLKPSIISSRLASENNTSALSCPWLSSDRRIAMTASLSQSRSAERCSPAPRPRPTACPQESLAPPHSSTSTRTQARVTRDALPTFPRNHQGLRAVADEGSRVTRAWPLPAIRVDRPGLRLRSRTRVARDGVFRRSRSRWISIAPRPTT